MFRSYWKTAWRNISRHKLFAVLNVLGLTLGICFCLVIFLITHFELSFDNFHPNGDRIYHLGQTAAVGNLQSWNSSRVMPGLPPAIRREVTGVESVTSLVIWEPKVKVPDEAAKSGYAE